MENIHHQMQNQPSSNPGLDSVTFANEKSFESGNYSEALTAFAVGWNDAEPLCQLLDFIAPAVPVARRFEFKRSDHSEAFLSEIDDVRAEGAAFKRVAYTGESVCSKTLNKGLTVRIDHDEIVSDDWQERTVQKLLARLYRSELRRAMEALVLVCGEGIELKWSDANANGPDADVLKAILDGGGASGVMPKCALFGRKAWQLRHQYYASQDKAGAFAGLLLPPEGLATHLGLDAVRLAKERLEGASGTSYCHNVLLFNAERYLGKDDASNLKRFITPTPEGNFRVFVETHAKYTDISVEHYSHIVNTSSLGAVRLIIS
jgi:hypothetical protein